VYLLYWNFLPRLGKLLNTRSTERTCTRRRPPNAGSGAVTRLFDVEPDPTSDSYARWNFEPMLERRATTKNNENQSVCDRFSIVYLLLELPTQIW
jgi:hypothetical protein